MSNWKDILRKGDAWEMMEDYGTSTPQDLPLWGMSAEEKEEYYNSDEFLDVEVRYYLLDENDNRVEEDTDIWEAPAPNTRHVWEVFPEVYLEYGELIDRANKKGLNIKGAGFDIHKDAYWKRDGPEWYREELNDNEKEKIGSHYVTIEEMKNKNFWA